MHCERKIREDVFWVGSSDRRLALFENVFPIPRGVSYNAYLVIDDKTVLLDTVDRSVSGQFLENLSFVLADKKLDYLIVNHMEPDHCATMGEIILRYPEIKIVTNQKALNMIKQFFDFDIDSRVIVVKEGDVLDTGKHKFTFVMAPMVHWPEAMVTYDTFDKTLYSADAFGSFGAINGNIFADEVNFESEWLPDARRYYTNIVGKYGPQVQSVLKKAAGLEINMICPLHGPVWRNNLNWYIDKYLTWSSYTPEEKSVLIVYASVYGNTENAVNILAAKLADAGIKNIAMYDVSVTHPSVIVAEAFRCSHIVFASTTYNAGIFCNMETVLHDLKAHNLQKRTVAIIENGSWAPSAGSLMREIISSMKNMTILEESITLKSSLKSEQLPQIDALAEAIASSIMAENTAEVPVIIEPEAMFKLSYGLFVLTSAAEKDNGCIINAVMQITETPKRISIAVNKANYTHDLIIKSGIFNLSVLSEETPFKIFQHFGFQSGKTVDKFAADSEFATEPRSANGLLYLSQYANAFISAKVISAVDYGTHTLFTADITEAKVLSAVPSATYAYYFAHIKPKPQPTQKAKKGFVCRICGYVYEGEVLPPDFVCPICKHGAEDFEPLQ